MRERPPAPPPGPTLALALVTVLGWNLVFALTVDDGVIVPIALFACTMAAFAAFLGRARLRAWLRSTPTKAGLGILLGGGLALASWAGWWVGLQLVPGLESSVGGLYAALRMPPGPVDGLPLLALTILAEEILFRGLFLDLARSRLPDGAAIAAATGIYMLAQLGSGDWVLPVMGTLLGAFWGLLAVWSRDLVLPFLCHLVWDLLLFLAFPLIPAAG